MARARGIVPTTWESREWTKQTADSVRMRPLVQRLSSRDICAGFYYFVVPVYMFLKHLLLWPLSLVWKDAHKKLM